eukprot:GHVU01202586.1.p5 GENE.GHVU01202586.1~~GHVU01202586.1.p5  ORF type:complete len:100 (-),score=10.07 GHVU01202586.1:318-617(-)
MSVVCRRPLPHGRQVQLGPFPKGNEAVRGLDEDEALHFQVQERRVQESGLSVRAFAGGAPSYDRRVQDVAVCVFHTGGSCAAGSTCRYAHGSAELRAKP